MRDVLSMLHAAQDAIIRADASGTLTVDAGLASDKTVVALRRAADLLHLWPRSGQRRGDLLLVGPQPSSLDYVAAALPRSASTVCKQRRWAISPLPIQEEIPLVIVCAVRLVDHHSVEF